MGSIVDRSIAEDGVEGQTEHGVHRTSVYTASIKTCGWPAQKLDSMQTSATKLTPDPISCIPVGGGLDHHEGRVQCARRFTQEGADFSVCLAKIAKVVDVGYRISVDPMSTKTGWFVAEGPSTSSFIVNSQSRLRYQVANIVQIVAFSRSRCRG